ncbi:hypothetical protein BSK59_13850 [Paenibacillus odorifer]|uniref:hypothetical protein n=1 Tax=Paenibacillus odorifer TaxID=189426 RepID=UPI00096F1582|nr:hypothetical protein [Paenibacillus odorifer]OME55554.1 hypothetical protein BSK59_13850 [Paenibacillus odorifer]
MSLQYFKIKNGTEFDTAVKKHLNMLPNWKQVYGKLSELLDEKITLLVQASDYLQIDCSEIKKEENQKLFKKDGSLRANSKKAKEVLAAYKDIIEECGLKGFENLGHINFCYGVMRFQGETMKSFKTSEHDIYYEASFDLEERSKGLVIPITDIEYQEKYLEELKKQKVA